MSSDAHAYSRELIEAAQQGEEYALETLIQMHQGLLWMLARRLCCERPVCEELVQAGNLGLIYALEHYEASHDTRLITYAVPWILGEMRRLLKRMEISTCSLDRTTDEDGQSLHDVLAGDMGMDFGHIDLRMALSRLNHDEQILICLRYYRDKTQKEAAAMLGKSQAQISRMERRALDALHAMLS